MSDHHTPVALITGAGKKRIGWHVAQALADRGYALAIHYRPSAHEAAETVQDLQASRRSRLTPSRPNWPTNRPSSTWSTSRPHPLRPHRRPHQHRRHLVPKPLEEVTADDLRRNFEVNTLGTFLTCQHAGLAMVDQPQAAASSTSATGPTARPYLNYSAYFPSKGAIPTLTRCLAVELGTRNPRVRVNAILPGPVMIPDDVPQEERDQVIKATLVKREGSPLHIVQAVLYLLDADFVTGTCLPVDGGRTIYAGGN